MAPGSAIIAVSVISRHSLTGAMPESSRAVRTTSTRSVEPSWRADTLTDTLSALSPQAAS